ncbi:MAG: PTS sugar transporter subunit IIC [Clostridia bacterium]|nr:PTS sugar transporter subunit IIC [Clostridia bacterium]
MTEEKRSFKTVAKSLSKRWFIDAFSGMAQGLFCTLIAGTILEQIGKWIGNNFIGQSLVSIAAKAKTHMGAEICVGIAHALGFIGQTLVSIAAMAKMLMGAGIGVGIAHALGANKLTMFSAAVAGFAGAFADKLILGNVSSVGFGLPGNPIGAYVVSLLAIEIVSLYAGKTKLDILIVPLGTLLLVFVGMYLAYPFIWLIKELGILIEKATDIAPFFMGIIISVVMGVLLTMPTSSAAIWISIASGVTSDAMLLAGGAAVVGCSCHMIGFAVASFRENGVSGLVSQGVGTSMLQIPNIMKKPIIMLPEIIASAILGPVSTCLFKLKCTATGGGMGTSGLVGVFGVIDASATLQPWVTVLGIVLLMFVLPAVICFTLSEIFRKIGWIKEGDQKL